MVTWEGSASFAFSYSDAYSIQVTGLYSTNVICFHFPVTTLQPQIGVMQYGDLRQVRINSLVPRRCGCYIEWLIKLMNDRHSGLQFWPWCPKEIYEVAMRLDYSKAFDLISHQIVLKKLPDMGTPALLLPNCPVKDKVMTKVKPNGHIWGLKFKWYVCFLACSRACASKVFSLRADCGRVIVYPGLKQWERPRHNIFGVCTRLAGGVCMSTSANSSASKHLTVTKIVWKIVYVTFDYLISHFFKILSLEFMANLFRDFRASVSLKVFHYRLRGKWCQYDLEIN